MAPVSTTYDWTTSYPTVFAAIAAAADHGTLLVLRCVSQHTKELADAQLFRALVVVDEGARTYSGATSVATASSGATSSAAPAPPATRCNCGLPHAYFSLFTPQGHRLPLDPAHLRRYVSTFRNLDVLAPAVIRGLRHAQIVEAHMATPQRAQEVYSCVLLRSLPALRMYREWPAPSHPRRMHNRWVVCRNTNTVARGVTAALFVTCVDLLDDDPPWVKLGGLPPPVRGPARELAEEKARARGGPEECPPEGGEVVVNLFFGAGVHLSLITTTRWCGLAVWRREGGEVVFVFQRVDTETPNPAGSPPDPAGYPPPRRLGILASVAEIAAYFPYARVTLVGAETLPPVPGVEEDMDHTPAPEPDGDPERRGEDVGVRVGDGSREEDTQEERRTYLASVLASAFVDAVARRSLQPNGNPSPKPENRNKKMRVECISHAAYRRRVGESGYELRCGRELAG